jgi:hypothetical protein
MVKLTFDSDFNKDFNKFKIEGNLYPWAQRFLEDQTDLILVNPNELTEIYGQLLSSIFNSVKITPTLKQAYSLIRETSIVVENNALFSETMIVEMLIKSKEIDKTISTGDVHIITKGNKKEDCVIDDSFKKYERADMPFCTDLKTFKIRETVSPWMNNLFAFNTEMYKNPWSKVEDKNVDHYVMVASGFLWGWLMTANNWNEHKEHITLFDISAMNLMHLENLIGHWSPWDQSYVDFVMENEYARNIFTRAGWIEGEDFDSSRKQLTELWDQEMERWSELKDSLDKEFPEDKTKKEIGTDIFLEFWHKLQYASANGMLSYANLNIISDQYLVKKLSTITKEGKTCWFVSNIFTSYASRLWSNGSKDNELVWFETFTKRLNKGDLILGRWPCYDEDEDKFLAQKEPYVI